ncbi:MAG: hypothetical protein ACPKPY_05460 [Nitrososphaeraceae archaeon]
MSYKSFVLYMSYTIFEIRNTITQAVTENETSIHSSILVDFSK